MPEIQWAFETPNSDITELVLKSTEHRAPVVQCHKGYIIIHYDVCLKVFKASENGVLFGFDLQPTFPHPHRVWFSQI